MEPQTNSLSELQIELKRAEERNDALMTELRTFLDAIGARGLTDALERHRRFAAIAIDLPKKIERLQADIAGIEKTSGIQQTLNERLQIIIGTQRTELNKQVSANQHTANNSRAIRAALDLCEEAFTSPIFSQFARETAIILRSVQAAKRTLSPVMETEEDAEIHSA